MTHRSSAPTPRAAVEVGSAALCPTEAQTAVLNLLRAAGYRLTAPRRALVEVLLAAEVPLRAEDVYDRVRPAGMNLSTVYRNLNTFVAMGWLDAVPGLNGERHYRVHQAQAPSLALVCLDCGKVNQLVALPDPALGAAARALGYKAESLRVQLAAHCNNECGREAEGRLR